MNPVSGRMMAGMSMSAYLSPPTRMPFYLR